MMMRVAHIKPSGIFVRDGRRPVDTEMVARLADSINRLGMLQPLTVSYTDGNVCLVAGAHRLAAAKKLGLAEVPVVLVEGNDVELRLAEIAENLHRVDLTTLERDEQLAEWIRLTEAKRVQSSQSATIESKRVDGRGHRPEGGVNAASRELGVSKADAHRAVKVADLAPEAKKAARELRLDDNRTALLEAAQHAEPEQQVDALQRRSRKLAEIVHLPKRAEPAAENLSGISRLKDEIKKLKTQKAAVDGHNSQLLGDLQESQANQRRLQDQIDELTAKATTSAEPPAHPDETQHDRDCRKVLEAWKAACKSAQDATFDEFRWDILYTPPRAAVDETLTRVERYAVELCKIISAWQRELNSEEQSKFRFILRMQIEDMDATAQDRAAASEAVAAEQKPEPHPLDIPEYLRRS